MKQFLGIFDIALSLGLLIIFADNVTDSESKTFTATLIDKGFLILSATLFFSSLKRYIKSILEVKITVTQTEIKEPETQEL